MPTANWLLSLIYPAWGRLRLRGLFLSGIFFGRQDGVQRVAFLSRTEFHDSLVGDNL
jgi:hypothetical protein